LKERTSKKCATFNANGTCATYSANYVTTCENGSCSQRICQENHLDAQTGECI